MSQNPYDRRRGARPAMPPASAGTFGWGVATRPDSPLRIEDLEAIALQAHARGAEESTARARESERDARREAWDQGYGEGRAAATAEMLALIDRRWGPDARKARASGTETITKYTMEDRSVTKRELVLALEAVTETLSDLIQAHHDGFPEKPSEDLPF